MDIIGKGIDWSYRNQNGFYYSQDYIKSGNSAWNFGYAWVDKERRYLYVNLYRVASPDGTTPSDINGKYSLSEIKD